MTIADVLAPFGVAEADYAAELERQLRAAPNPHAATLTETERSLLDRFGGVDRPTADDADEGLLSLRVTTANLADQIRDSISVSDAAELLGVDGSRVRHRVADGAMYGFKVGGRLRLPRWQFTEDGEPLPGLRTVLAALPVDLHPLEVAGFMSTSDPDLLVADQPTSPRDWLAAGGSAAIVAELARGLDRW
jgi:hypothetical protein